MHEITKKIKAICKSDITRYGVRAEYYIEAMEKLEKQRKIKLEKAEKLSIAKTVLKAIRWINVY